MNPVVRSASVAIERVLLPGGAAAVAGPRSEIGAELVRSIVRPAHDEMGIAMATDAIVHAASASAFETSHQAPRFEEELAELRRKATEEGLAEGRRVAADEHQLQLEQFEAILDGLAAARDDLMPVVEDEIVAIVLAAVAEIVGSDTVQMPLVRQAVSKACRDVAANTPITVRVAPGQILASASSDLLDPAARDGKVEVVEDARVSLGGCIVETVRGSLDARLETQLERLKTALLAARAQP